MGNNDTTNHPLVRRLLEASKTLGEEYSAVCEARTTLNRAQSAPNERYYPNRLKRAAGDAVKLQKVVTAQHLARGNHYAAHLNLVRAQRPYVHAHEQVRQLLIEIGTALNSQNALDRSAANELAEHVLHLVEQPEWKLSGTTMKVVAFTEEQLHLAQKAIKSLYRKFLQGEVARFDFDSLSTFSGQGYRNVNNSVLAEAIQESIRRFLAPGVSSGEYLDCALAVYQTRKAAINGPLYYGDSLESALLKGDQTAVDELDISRRRDEFLLVVARKRLHAATGAARKALANLKKIVDDAKAQVNKSDWQDEGLLVGRTSITIAVEVMWNVMAADAVINSLKGKINEAESQLHWAQVSGEFYEDAPIIEALKDVIAANTAQTILG